MLPIQKLKRQLVWLGALLGCIVTTEVALRIVLGLGTPVLIAPDESEAAGGFGYAFAPDQDVRRFFARNTINHFSMRISGDLPAKTADRLRVYFIGDSVTYGTTYIDQSLIFTSLIQQRLAQKINRNADVLNASVGGWAPSNEVAFLKKRGTFNADLIFLVLNTADLDQPFANYEPNINFLTRAPMTALGELWSRYIAPRLFVVDTPVDPGSVSDLSISNVAEQTTAVLKTLDGGREYSAAHGAKFGIVYIPARSTSWDGPAFRESYHRLEDWCRRRSVPLIDLTPDFTGKPTHELYLDGGASNIHLTREAHAIVANRVISELPAILSPTGN